MLALPRRPTTDDELYWLIVALWGIRLPRTRVCPDHVSPFEALAHAYFAREPNFAVWYASRGSGKSLALSVLGLTKAFVDEVDVTILGGSMTQSMNVRQHMSDVLEHRNAPRAVIAKDIQTLIETKAGTKIKPLPASQTTVRGPHPPLQLLDEVDEMDLAIYDAALGQAMEQESKNPFVQAGKMAEYIVASSTWQNPEGTFSTVIDRARENGSPIFTWCWRELLEENGGWMGRRFIENKRKTVSAQMWATEYELGEPSGTSRAFDLDKVAQYFIVYPNPITIVDEADEEEWVWEEPQVNGIYAVGADWAKEIDKTVITVVRYDVTPHRIVKARVLNRTSWPVMIGWYNADKKAYNAVGQHDKTGIGNVINDYVDDRTGGFVFIGRKRTTMLLNYIAAFESGRYLLPKQLKTFYRAHRSATVGDVFAPAKWNGHLPDEVASMALVNRAIDLEPAPVPELPLVPKRSGDHRKIDRQFYAKPEVGADWREDLVVTVVGSAPSEGYDLMIG